MNYNIKGTDITITDEIRTYLEKRLAHLDKFVKDAGKPRVDVEVHQLQGEARMYKAEMMLHAPGTTEPLYADAEGASLHEAIDAAGAELLHELTKTKKRRLRIFRHGAASAKEFLRGFRDRF